MKIPKYLFYSCLLILAVILLSRHPLSIPTNADTAFEKYTLCLFREEVSSNTIHLHYSVHDPDHYGITEAPVSFGSFETDPLSASASIENQIATLQKFPYNTLSETNQLTYDILYDHLETRKDLLPYLLYEEPLAPASGIHAQLPILLAEYQFSSEEDVRTYLQLLHTFPAYFDSLIAFERQKAEAGLFMTQTHADEVIAQCNAFITSPKEHYLTSTFCERLETLSLTTDQIASFEAEQLTILETKIFPSYQKLSAALIALRDQSTAPLGLCRLPDGQQYYELLASSLTGSSRDIKEMKSLIQHQIQTDLADASLLLQKAAAVTNPVSSQPSSPNDILETLKHKISFAFPAPAAVGVEVKYVPGALESYLSPAFYLLPTIDHYEDNIIYINQGYALDDLSLFTTLAHEGYPGHLYQTTYFASTNPDPIRMLLSAPGYVEGWATYAEMCSYYISPYEKNSSALSQKNQSVILGLYARADIGIHYDGWTLSDTIAFFSSYGISDKTAIEEIFYLILGDPANYVTYYLGYVEFLELKKDAIKSCGEAFDERSFHQTILELGPAPFALLRKYMEL